MSTIRNRVILIGNVGADPEMKNFNDNGKLARFNLATNENYRNSKGEKVTETQWHQVVAWNKSAEIAEKYVKKGSEIAVEGKLVTRDYEDAQGQKKYITEVVLQELLLLGKKPE